MTTKASIWTSLGVSLVALIFGFSGCWKASGLPDRLEKVEKETKDNANASADEKRDRERDVRDLKSESKKQGEALAGEIDNRKRDTGLLRRSVSANSADIAYVEAEVANTNYRVKKLAVKVDDHAEQLKAHSRQLETQATTLSSQGEVLQVSGLRELAAKAKTDPEFKIASQGDVKRNKPVAIDTSKFLTGEQVEAYKTEVAAAKKAYEDAKAEKLSTAKANEKIANYNPMQTNDPTEDRWYKRRPENAGGGYVRQIIVDRKARVYIPNLPNKVYDPGQPEWYGYLTKPGSETELQALVWIRKPVCNLYGQWYWGPERQVWRKVIKIDDVITLPKDNDMLKYDETVDAAGFPDAPDPALNIVAPKAATKR